MPAEGPPTPVPNIIIYCTTLRVAQSQVSDFLTWESVFSDATTSTEITIPAGRTVVLHGCAQPANTVSVKSITIPAGSTVSTTHYKFENHVLQSKCGIALHE